MLRICLECSGGALSQICTDLVVYRQKIIHVEFVAVKIQAAAMRTRREVIGTDRR